MTADKKWKISSDWRCCPSRHETLNQCCFNDSILGQLQWLWSNIIQIRLSRRHDSKWITADPPPRHQIIQKHDNIPVARAMAADCICERVLRSKEYCYLVTYLFWFIAPLAAKLFNWNFHSLDVVSHWLDPQLQVGENYSDFTKWRSTILTYHWLMLSRFIWNIFKILIFIVLITNENNQYNRHRRLKS